MFVIRYLLLAMLEPVCLLDYGSSAIDSFIFRFMMTGKTQIWKTLFKTYQNLKRRPHAVDRKNSLTMTRSPITQLFSISLVDPKAVTNDELFGYMHRQTREWKDGLFSTIMRDLANMTTDGTSI